MLQIYAIDIFVAWMNTRVYRVLTEFQGQHYHSMLTEFPVEVKMV